MNYNGFIPYYKLKLNSVEIMKSKTDKELEFLEFIKKVSELTIPEELLKEKQKELYYLIGIDG